MHIKCITNNNNVTLHYVTLRYILLFALLRPQDTHTDCSGCPLVNGPSKYDWFRTILLSLRKTGELNIGVYLEVKGCGSPLGTWY